MMLLKKHKSKNNPDKTRLEHKLYLARENPEPIFDISECNLQHVPNGIYSLCKVFRKKELKIMKNRLSSLSGGGMLSDLSLLLILDLSDNEFISLPSEINSLKLLEELYLHNNSIKNLPKELTELSNLKILNTSNNKLKSLPKALGNLKNLTVLDISKNSLITELPKSLGEIGPLRSINFDGLSISYPPESIIKDGVSAIMKFLASECGAINSEVQEKSSEFRKKIEMDDSNQMITPQQTNKNDKLQEQKQSTLLQVEQSIKDQQKSELELQSTQNNNKKKLLEDLILQQLKLESKIEKVQQEKGINRSRLLSSITNTEKEADGVIKEFLTSSEIDRQAQSELCEREKKEQMKILSRSYLDQSSCRTKETLLAMEELLNHELLTERKFKECTKFREFNAQSFLNLELRNNHYLSSVLQNQKQDRKDLIDEIQNDEVFQKAALATLLEKSDERSWSIVQQVNLVQSQLGALTNIELERKKLQTNQQINDLADKRVVLSEILVNLLEQQEKRRAQLLETMNQIEQQRDQSSSNHFWLMQYQALMEVRPQGLLEGLESTLVRHIAIAGALHCLPFLSTLPTMLPHVTDDDLKSIGIHNENDRCAIVLAVDNYLVEKKMINDELATPLVPTDGPSTSSMNNQDNKTILSNDAIECVVCLDSECEIIFLPCGHLCCCANCSSMVTLECPMCRGSIQRKIQLRKP